MHIPDIKQKALKLRRSGISINDIARSLQISKSTISFWCKDTILSDKAMEKINSVAKNKSIRALLKYSESQRQKRLDRVKINKIEGKILVGDLSDRDLFILGLGLYWGEGYKGDSGEFGFTNMNPDMIRFYLKWLNIFNIEKENLIFRLSINALFEKQEKTIRKFWCDFLHINNSQFSKTTFVQTQLKKRSTGSSDMYKGVLRVKVRKGLVLKNIVLGAIEYIALQK